MKLLYRSVNGLLYGKNSYGSFINIPVADDWNEESVGLAVNTVIIGDGATVLRITSTTALTELQGLVRNNKVASQTQVCIFMRVIQVTGTPRFGVLTHVGNISEATANCVVLSLPVGYTYTAGLREYVNAVVSYLDSLTGVNIPVNTPVNLLLFSDGNTSIGYDTYTTHDWTGTSSLTSGSIGLISTRTSTSVNVLTYLAMADRYFIINGLSSGNSIELRSSTGTVLGTYLQSGGSVIIDIFDFKTINLLSINRLVVVNNSQDIAQYTIGPALFISGGSTYTVNTNINVIPDAGNTKDCRYYEYGTHLYIASLSAHGEVKISQVEMSTKETVTTVLETLNTADEHNIPKVLIDSSGYIWIFYSLHGIDTNLYYYRSTNPDDISSFESKQTISGFSGNCTYVFPFQRVDGRIVVFTRSSTDTQGRWQVAWTDNNGSSWTNREWINGSSIWIYFAAFICQSNHNLINCALRWHPSESTLHDIRIFSIDLNSGNVLHPDSTIIGNLYSGDLIDYADTMLIKDGTSTDHWQIVDMSEDGDILAINYNADDPQEIYYKYFHISSGVVDEESDIITSDWTGFDNAMGLVGGGGFVKHDILCINYNDGSNWIVRSFKNIVGVWTPDHIYSDNIPNEDVEILIWPTLSATNKISKYLMYIRQKDGGDDVNWIYSRDTIITDIVKDSIYEFELDCINLHLYSTSVRILEVDPETSKINFEFPNGVILCQK